MPIWKKNLIREKKKCIDTCENDDIYKYEYNNTCYKECPNNTIANDTHKYICFDQIFLTTIITEYTDSFSSSEIFSMLLLLFDLVVLKLSLLL